MNQSAQAWMEIIFNVAYLIVVWGLVVAMLRKQGQLPPAQSRLRELFVLAFGLLALGDTGHVGFRVWAYLQGDPLTANPSGDGLGLVGFGALATAVTVTLFYVVMLFIWRERFHRSLGLFGAFLLAMAGLRLLIMLFPQNQWSSTIPPQPWSLYRNLPLTILGLGVAYLILRDATAENDRAFRLIGIMILVSYAFYVPVILFVQQVPAVGMLMIPKTLAYVAIGFIAYNALFRSADRVSARPAT